MKVAPAPDLLLHWDFQFYCLAWISRDLGLHRPQFCVPDNTRNNDYGINRKGPRGSGRQRCLHIIGNVAGSYSYLYESNFGEADGSGRLRHCRLLGKRSPHR